MLFRSVLSMGLMSFNNFFSKSEPKTHTYVLFSISKLVKFRPFTILSPEFGIKYSSTPRTDASGSVFLASNFTSAVEVAVNETEVLVKGYLKFSLNDFAFVHA